MSSHWKWVEAEMAEHDRTQPFAPENGNPLKFAVGDHVIFTNDYGVEFALTVTGIYERPEKPCGQYAHGARYYLNKASHWFPVSEASLRVAKQDQKPSANQITDPQKSVGPPWFEIRVDGETFIKGDELSIGVVFWNLDGRNSLTACPGSMLQNWQDYIESISKITKTKLQPGAEIQLANTQGVKILASKIGASIP